MTRKCGDCTLCCRLVPVVELGKKAGERCQHQRYHKGCAIYGKHPVSCRLWSCKWLVDGAAAGLPRPDRAHYVIDIMPDFVTMTHDDTGERHEIPVQQVWVDPHHREAWRTPEFRGFMLQMAADHGMATIIRWSSTEALTVFAPPFAADGEWHEVGGQITARNDLERQILEADNA